MGLLAGQIPVLGVVRRRPGASGRYPQALGRTVAALVAVVVVAAFTLAAPPEARAAGTVEDCTEFSLRAALQDGGVVTIECTDPIVIEGLEGSISIASDTTIEGGGATIRAGLTRYMVEVMSGVTLDVRDVNFDGADSGAGIISNGGTLKISGSAFAHHVPVFPSFRGAAIHAEGGRVDIAGSGFSDNGATDNETDATIYIVGSATASIDHTEVSGNRGRGIYNAGTLSLSDSLVSGNTNFFGGAGIRNGGTLTVTRSTIADNHATDQDGGGIYNGGSLTVTDSTISGNNANFGGGGVHNDAGRLTVIRSTFSGNIAERGGGIHNEGIFEEAELSVTNSTFFSNEAVAFGGGAIHDSIGLSSINYSTMLANTSGSGAGAVYADFGTVSLSNTIMDRGDSGSPNCAGQIIDGDFNLSDDGTCPFTQPHSKPNIDPKLGPNGLQSNGGPTQTIALQLGSPALNKITAGTNGCGTNVTNDQRGIPRPQGAKCDIGAFELNRVPTIDVAGGACLNAALSARANFTINDKETAARGLTLTATTRNPTVVRPENLVLGGTGGNRTLTLNASSSGTAVITLTVSDGSNASTLDLTVLVPTPLFASVVDGTSGPDVLFSLAPNSRLDGAAGRDLLCGSGSQETLIGGPGSDVIQGRNGNDILDDRDGNDNLFGGNGDDTLTGGAEADRFSGGPGTDTATDFDASAGDTQDGTIP